jgi:hypothetical protein
MAEQDKEDIRAICINVDSKRRIARLPRAADFVPYVGLYSLFKRERELPEGKTVSAYFCAVMVYQSASTIVVGETFRRLLEYFFT